MKKPEKLELVDSLTKELSSATCIVLVDYAGMNMALLTELKKELAKSGAKLKIVKNTLFAIAGKNIKAPEEALQDSVLQGPTALIFSDSDPVAPLQIIGKFAKEKELPQFKIGIVEGKFQDKTNLITLSKLPSKDVLVAQALGAIAAPLYGFVSILQAPMQKLVYILDSKLKMESSK